MRENAATSAGVEDRVLVPEIIATLQPYHDVRNIVISGLDGGLLAAESHDLLLAGLQTVHPRSLSREPQAANAIVLPSLEGAKLNGKADVVITDYSAVAHVATISKMLRNAGTWMVVLDARAGDLLSMTAGMQAEARRIGSGSMNNDHTIHHSVGFNRTVLLRCLSNPENRTDVPFGLAIISHHYYQR